MGNPSPVTPQNTSNAVNAHHSTPIPCAQHPTKSVRVPWQALKAASCHIAKQLGLQNVLSFFVLLARLKCLIILPAYRLVALSAGNISHDVSACCHIPLASIARRNVDDVVEKIRLPMLAPEILTCHVSNRLPTPARAESKLDVLDL